IHSDNNVNDKAHEDDYELPQILLTDILKTIKSSEILEIWRLTFSCNMKSQFVILILDDSHRCTCNMLVIYGYPCYHFYKILRTSPCTQWHIGLILKWWYRDNKIDNDQDFLIQHNPISLCIESSKDYA
ncbi:12644_t:CDS:1, partial [Racocetra persica]